jgi:hypothetical protein
LELIGGAEAEETQATFEHLAKATKTNDVKEFNNSVRTESLYT